MVWSAAACHHHTTASQLPSSVQSDRLSAYRAYNSTQTAVLKVLSDTLSAADTGSLSMLTLLDLLAAFDTVDHPVLLRRLQTWRHRPCMVYILPCQPNTVHPL